MYVEKLDQFAYCNLPKHMPMKPICLQYFFTLKLQILLRKNCMGAMDTKYSERTEAEF